MNESVNYPDILGLITGGYRCNIGVAQVAVAALPRIVRAGRPFEVILLVQNASDDPIDVSMALHLPKQDAKKQRDRFICRTQRLVVGVKGAEVGYVVLPVTTLPDTAVSDSYKIGVEFEIKPLGKPNRIRLHEGRGKVSLELMSEASKTKIEALKTANFYTEKQGTQSLIEIPLTVMSGTVGNLADFTPGWVSISKMSDYGDDRLLLHRFGPLIQVHTLPQLKRDIMLPPLIEATYTRFAEAGYPLKLAETTAIAKLMTLILEYATPRYNAHGNIAAGSYNMEALLQRDPFTLEAHMEFPHWFRGLLTMLERDERAAAHLAVMIPRYLYDDLLRDAIDFGFNLVEGVTGEDLGSLPERAAYRERVIHALAQKSGVDFSTAYLPLAMGGILVNEHLIFQKENPLERLQELEAALYERVKEPNPPDQGTYITVSDILARVAQRNGA
jgi:hypothetical protein